MLCGVVEGFYGRPYNPRKRRILFDYLSMLDEAGYVYAPKNDPFHRLSWREDYPEDEWSQLSETIGTAVSTGLEFIFGISPWQFRRGDSGFHERFRKSGKNGRYTGRTVSVHVAQCP
ncbi:MAG: beta-N-acetylglucosaminidase domain-containing protein [Candidatus Aegiribacteria sp.]|nr:beta-N-acetylglucosaminidase domain-containing protein [Candidatus Aegiribacteria sp.]